MSSAMSSVLSGCDFVAGCVSGVCGLVVGHPLDTVKVWKQTLPGHSTTTQVVRTIYSHEGFRGFYKGMMFPLLTSGALNALFFGIYGNTLRALQEVRGVRPTVREAGTLPYREWHKDIFVAGCVGGFVTVLVSCPVELVKTQMQTQTREPNLVIKRTHQYRGPWECLVDQYRSRGLQGLYRGLVPLLWRDVPTFGLYVLSYEYMLYLHAGHGSYPPLATQVVGGAMAGFISWATVVPLDVIKNRVQADSKTNPRYRGMLDCAVKSYRNEGLPVFFRGFWIIVLRSLPVNAVTFVGYELVISTCRKRRELVQ